MQRTHGNSRTVSFNSTNVPVRKNGSHVGYFDPHRAKRLVIHGITAQGVAQHGHGEWRELFQLEDGQHAIAHSFVSAETFGVKTYDYADLVDHDEAERFQKQYDTLEPGDLPERPLVDFTPLPQHVGVTEGTEAPHTADPNPQEAVQIVVDDPLAEGRTNDGPYAVGCFRLGNKDASGFGNREWKLLKALWGRACGSPVGPHFACDVARFVYSSPGTAPLDKLPGLCRDLQNKLTKLEFPLQIETEGRGPQRRLSIIVIALR